MPCRGSLLPSLVRSSVRLLTLGLFALMTLSVPRNETEPEALPKAGLGEGIDRIPYSLVDTQAPRVFYNRVPKCGSHTMLDILGDLAARNNFTLARSKHYMQFTLDEDYQTDFVQEVESLQTPLIYERHLHFLDFRRQGASQPAYINLIRDPLQRMVSWYYFRRYQNGHKRNLSDKDRTRTFDECVLSNVSECVDAQGDKAEEGYFKVIPFFCGQDPVCRVPGNDSLSLAIQNVKAHYVVVGIIEEMADFVAALEALLPNYFRGAGDYFQEKEKELWEKHQTTYKIPPTVEVSAIMKEKLFYEYKFYNFVRSYFREIMREIRTR